MVRRIRIVDIILGCFVFDVHHFVQHAALSNITEYVHFQSFPALVTFSPQLFMSASTCANPQSILQTEEPISNIFHSLRLTITKTINYPCAARLNKLLMWLQ